MNEILRARNAALRAGFHGGELDEIIDELRERIERLTAEMEKAQREISHLQSTIKYGSDGP